MNCYDLRTLDGKFTGSIWADECYTPRNDDPNRQETATCFKTKHDGLVAMIWSDKLSWTLYRGHLKGVSL